MASLLPGATCGPYTVARLLCAGAFAEVYEAITPEGERRALKIGRERIPLDSSLQARIAQEVESLAMIEHAYVVRFYDAGVHEGRVWLALELVDGVDIRQIVDPLDASQPGDSARGGTMPMPVLADGASDAPGAARASGIGPSGTPTIPGPEPVLSYSGSNDGREALPPPAPPSLPPLPETLRAPSQPSATPALPAPSLAPPIPAALSMLAAPERRSTSVPVESAASPPRETSRAMRGVHGVLLGAAAVLVLGAAVWWTVFGREAARPSAASQPSMSAPVSAPVVAPVSKPPAVTPSASASVTASATASAAAPPRRPPAAPASPRRKLPF